jgi:hypothetical protein
MRPSRDPANRLRNDLRSLRYFFGLKPVAKTKVDTRRAAYYAVDKPPARPERRPVTNPPMPTIASAGRINVRHHKFFGGNACFHQRYQLVVENATHLVDFFPSILQGLRYSPRRL